MSGISPNRVYVQYRNPATPSGPLSERKYTITHSDEMGDIFVTIGPEFAEDRINDMRDEVRLEWKDAGGYPYLYGTVLIDGEGKTGNEKVRNMAFYYNMPSALYALREADRFLFETYTELNHAQVGVSFLSRYPDYRQNYTFGNIGSYAQNATTDKTNLAQ